MDHQIIERMVNYNQWLWTNGFIHRKEYVARYNRWSSWESVYNLLTGEHLA